MENRSQIQPLRDANGKQKDDIHHLRQVAQEGDEKVVEQELYFETLDEVSLKGKRLGQLRLQIFVQEERITEELQLKHFEAATKDAKIVQALRDIASLRHKLKRLIRKLL